jgi:hypothetical protein
MVDLSIEQIKQKANQAKDLFNTYIDNLVNAGETRKASNREIELFNLTTEYLDNKISVTEAIKIKEKINGIPFGDLVNNKDIFYNNGEKKLSIIRGNIDINEDGNFDLKDLTAIDYLINFKGDKINALENILDIAGNQDRTIQFNINQWASARGLEKGTQEYNNFFNKFYNQLYQNSNPKLNFTSLQRILRFYDAGLGKNNLNEIDLYLPAINTDSPFNVVINLYQFANSKNFNVSEGEKQAKINSYIDIIKGSDTELKRVLAEALIRKTISINGKELNVTNLDYMLNIYKNPDKEEQKQVLNEITINQWADQRNLIGDKREEFIQKLKFFSSPSGIDLSLAQLKILTDIYDINHKKSNSNFEIGKLDIYANGVKQNVSQKTLLSIYKFETSENFSLREPERSLKLQEYFTIATSQNSKLQSYLLQALNTNKIPFSLEPLNVETLDKFLETIKTQDGIIDLEIDSWAKQRNITGTDNIKFKTKLKEYHTKGINENQLKSLLKFYDDGQLNKKKFPLEYLDIYVLGLQKKISIKQINNLYKFETGTNFNLQGVERSNELENLINVFSGGANTEKDIRKRDVLEKTLNGKKVFLTNLDISIENIKKTFAIIDDEVNNGYENLQIENLANERQLLNPDRERFIKKLKEWHLPQIDTSKNLQLKMIDINNLTKLYDEKKLGLDDLEIYAKALKQNIPFNSLQNIYKFEVAIDLKNKNSNRDLRISQYLEILKSDNQEKKQVMISAMKTGRIPILDELLKKAGDTQVEDSQLDKFFDILKKYDNQEELTKTTINHWATNPKFPRGFKEKFLDFYNNPDIKINLNELTTLKNIFEKNPEYDLNNLDIYAKAIKAKIGYSDLQKIFKLNSDNRFNGTKEQVNKLLQIMTTGDKKEKSIINQILKSNTIPYINKKFLNENSANFNDLEKVLNLVKNEKELNRFLISTWAKEDGLKEGTNDYTNFMNKFFDDYLIDKKISINVVKVLKDIYSFKKYSFSKMDKMANALNTGISIFDIKRLDDMSNRMNWSEDQFTRYLNIALGQEGEAKKKIVLEMIKTNMIPISNIAL